MNYLFSFFQVTTSYMKMVSSYVMQDDQLFPMLTVFETFMFAAEVRLPPSISRDEKKNRVYELLDQLGLQVKLLDSVSVVMASSLCITLSYLTECSTNIYRGRREERSIRRRAA